MSTITTNDFVNLIDRRLDQVLKYPQGWGGVDTLEPLVLMLLMLRASVDDATPKDRIVVDGYRKFLAARVGGGAADLRARLGEDCSEVRMAEILREHVERVRAHALMQTILSKPPTASTNEPLPVPRRTTRRDTPR